MSNVLQYSLWSNCCNACDFCLRRERIPYSRQRQLNMLDRIKKNLDYIDWQDKFSNGISLLGGEIYYIRDEKLQESFLELIDLIIDKVLLASPNPDVKYSTVTNGIYNPDFLFKVIDRIVERVGLQCVDLNFSYDLKHRYKKEEDRLLVIENVNKFHDRYNYCTGIQMILTQWVIDMWKEGFDVIDHVYEVMPGNQLCFLYPHPIQTGLEVDKFNFSRADLLKYLQFLKAKHPHEYASFMQSTMNSCTYKWTGLRNRKSKDFTQQPELTDGKEEITECGHSVLYRCYTDSEACLLCDLYALDEEVFYG